MVLNPSTAAFLNSHNMNFDLWCKQGIPFVTESIANDLVQKYAMKTKEAMDKATADTQQQVPVQEIIRRRVQLTRSDDVDFFARATASLREWLDAPVVDQETPEGTSFLLPPCNSFLRRALYESIQQEYPSLVLENAGPQFPNQIRVVRLNEQEKRQREQRLFREEWENLMVEKIGVWRVFEAIARVCRGEQLPTNSILFAESVGDIDWNAQETIVKRPQIPLVVHNGFMDICFLMTHFSCDFLPGNLQDCKSLIRSYFPIIYDTKVMVTEHDPFWYNDNSNLQVLYQKVISENTAPNVDVIDNLDPSAVVPDQEHEAGFDAFMTGVVYIGVRNRIEQAASDLSRLEASSREIFGSNKFYQMSLFTMDLEASRDPLSRGMMPTSAFLVKGIDPSVVTRDIVRCLTGLRDSRGMQVNFDIIWVDDTTFIAAACYRITTPVNDGVTAAVSYPSNAILTEILEEHGSIVWQALRSRFTREVIISLDQHLEEQEKNVGSVLPQQQQQSWLSYIKGLFSFGSSKRSLDEIKDSFPVAKRQRMN